ncbi:MAG: creatininase family protein [Woeseiaceae bacterium]
MNFSIARLLGGFCLLLAATPVLSDNPGAYLGDLSWPEAEARIQQSPVVVIPFAAGAKEHGAHLPMNADQVVMEYLVDQAVSAADVLIAPPILHGWFPAFRGFSGTEVKEPDVFEEYLFQVAMSLAEQGANRIVFLNTGITNATGLPISIVAREIRVQTGVPTLVISWNDLETAEVETFTEQREGGHGDEIETSINLFLQPDKVNMDLAVRDYGNRPEKDYPGYEPGLFSRDPLDPRYSESGIYGDATLATAAKGERALAIMTAEWLRAIEGFAAVPTRRTE